MTLPSIQIQYPTTPIEPAVQEKWEELVGNNLGAEVRALYHDATEFSLFEPAVLERKGVEEAVQLFRAELTGRDKKFDPGKLETFDDVAEAVKEAAGDWEKRKRYFPGFQDGLVNLLNSAGHYKNLAAIFPSQSQYTSTLCSAFKILITAATNYKETAEGLTKGLSEITISAKNVSDLHGLFNTPEMLVHAVNFYASILKFCLAAIKWYRSRKRRIFGNLKDNLYDEVREIIISIKTRAEIIKETAAKGSMAELRIIHLKVDHQGVVLKQSMEELKVEELKRENWANRMEAMFRDLEQRALTPARSQRRSRSSRARSRSVDSRTEKTSAPVPRVYSQSDIVNYVQKHFCLEECNPHRELDACSKRPGNDLASCGRDFRERLASWMTANSSSVLWIRGNPSAQKISAVTSFAGQLIGSAYSEGIRVAFHFCTFYPPERECQPVITLIQRLILQLLESERMEFVTDTDLSEERFREVNTFDTAWGLFEDVIKLSPERTTFVAIDCPERFDIDENCGRLVERLNGLATNSTGRVLKILLTSKRKTTHVFDSLPEDAGMRLKTGPHQARGRSFRRKNNKWCRPNCSPHTSDKMQDSVNARRSTECPESECSDSQSGSDDGHCSEGD